MAEAQKEFNAVEEVRKRNLGKRTESVFDFYQNKGLKLKGSEELNSILNQSKGATPQLKSILFAKLAQQNPVKAIEIEIAEHKRKGVFVPKRAEEEAYQFAGKIGDTKEHYYTASSYLKKTLLIQVPKRDEIKSKGIGESKLEIETARGKENMTKTQIGETAFKIYDINLKIAAKAEELQAIKEAKFEEMGKTGLKPEQRIKQITTEDKDYVAKAKELRTLWSDRNALLESLGFFDPQIKRTIVSVTGTIELSGETKPEIVDDVVKNISLYQGLVAPIVADVMENGVAKEIKEVPLKDRLAFVDTLRKEMRSYGGYIKNPAVMKTFFNKSEQVTRYIEDLYEKYKVKM